jgi:5-methylcytosine-specific restriction endonuclease McrA
MMFIVMGCLFLSIWHPQTAYRLLSTSECLFEPDAGAAPQKNKRAYISPHTKKLIAAKQGWKCAMCHAVLKADFEIDHRIPLFKGGNNDTSNLQALCRSPCHIDKSARERQT